jgi:glutaredoxin
VLRSFVVLGAVVVGTGVLGGVFGACQGRGGEAGASRSDAAPEAAADARTDDDVPEAPVVRDDATHLLFSFVDAQGRVQTVPRVDAVPAPVRQRVLVIDLDKTPEQRQAHRFAFFADLTTPGPDGTYAVVAVSRYDAARKSDGPAVAPPQEGAVVVYSATWCGFCKKAKSWLQQNGVPFVERDVEKTPGAQAELDAKLKVAGVPGGGIPVIDWAGTLVVGFDVPSLQRLRREKPPAATAEDGAANAAADASPPPAPIPPSVLPRPALPVPAADPGRDEQAPRQATE